MSSTQDDDAVRPLAEPPPYGINEPPPEQSRPRGRALALVAAAALFAVQLVVLARAGATEPLDTVESFVTSFNAGDVDAVNDLLADDPSILSWPAGPPWGGVLQWTLELLPDTSEDARLTHAADLDDFVGFHHELGGDMRVERCRIEDDGAPAADPTWVHCRFGLVNDLSRALDPATPSAAGVVRFGIDDGAVGAVVVESWDVPAPSGVELLLWVRTARPDVFRDLLDGRLTVADYRASTARTLLELAAAYRTATG